jgi:hypothetical protein
VMLTIRQPAEPAAGKQRCCSDRDRPPFATMLAEMDSSCSSRPSSSETEREAEFLESACLPCAKKAKAAGMEVVVSFHQDGRREIRFASSSSSDNKDGLGRDVGMTTSSLRADCDTRDGFSARVPSLEAMTPEIMTTTKIPRQQLNVSGAASGGEPTAENSCHSDEASSGPTRKAPSAPATSASSNQSTVLSGAVRTNDGRASIDQIEMRAPSPTDRHENEKPESLAINGLGVDALVSLNAPPPSNGEDKETRTPFVEPRRPGHHILANGFLGSEGSTGPTDASSLILPARASWEGQSMDQLESRESEPARENHEPSHATEWARLDVESKKPLSKAASASTVLASPHKTAAASSGSSIATAAQPGPSLLFDAEKCADSILIIPDNGAEGASVLHKASKGWGSALASHSLNPRSGVHRFAVRLDSCEFGNIFVGISTEQANVNSYLGRDRHSWGMMGKQAKWPAQLWHNKQRVRLPCVSRL